MASSLGTLAVYEFQNEEDLICDLVVYNVEELNAVGVRDLLERRDLRLDIVQSRFL